MSTSQSSNNGRVVQLDEKVGWLARGSGHLRRGTLGQKVILRHWGVGFCPEDPADALRLERATRRYNILYGTILVAIADLGLSEIQNLAPFLLSFMALMFISSLLDLVLYPWVMAFRFKRLRRVTYLQAHADAGH